MAVSNIKAVFSCEPEKVWGIVTSLTNYAWRSDISKIEIQESGKEFTEYTKDGYATHFKITVFEPYGRYEFDMENENIKGHWAGVFSYSDGQTTIDFTEDVTAKKFFMKPFVKSYLKKQQVSYLTDLKKKVGM